MQLTQESDVGPMMGLWESVQRTVTCVYDGVRAQQGPVIVQNGLTTSDDRSDGSRDILATARVESFPTRALYGASLP